MYHEFVGLLGCVAKDVAVVNVFLVDPFSIFILLFSKKDTDTHARALFR